MDYIKATQEFIEAMGQPEGQRVDDDANYDLLHLRAKLISEETDEVLFAVKDLKNLMLESKAGVRPVSKQEFVDAKAALLKELCDLQYVLSGFAVTFGLPFDEAFRRVHESNRSKLGPDGKPVYRDDGKVMKGPNYKEPNLTDLVEG